jgi:hypothetical protein
MIPYEHDDIRGRQAVMGACKCDQDWKQKLSEKGIKQRVRVLEVQELGQEGERVWIWCDRVSGTTGTSNGDSKFVGRGMGRLAK